MTAALLEIEDLAVSFDGGRGRPRIHAVQGLDLALRERGAVAVVGESGCGKSATALAVMRLVPPPGRVDRGAIRFEGADLLGLDERAMRRVRGGGIAMIFQEPQTSLNPVMTVGGQLVEALRLHRPGLTRREARAAAADAMASVGIPQPPRRLDEHPHELSGGMRQRVMIAMALACRPRVLLADEPTTALDVTVQARILDLLGALRRDAGLALLLITHDLALAAGHADELCVMYAGRAVEQGPVAACLERPLHPYTRALLRCRPRLGERRPRLATVADLMAEPAAMRVEGTRHRPWWPHQQPPAGSEGASALAEVEPAHHVRVWKEMSPGDISAGAAPIQPPGPSPGENVSRRHFRGDMCDGVDRGWRGGADAG